MSGSRFLLFLGALAGASVVLPAGSSGPAAQTDAAKIFDEAERLATTTEMAKARDLYRQASLKDPDARQRDVAAIRAAAIEWHVFENATAARTTLEAVTDESPEAARAWLERSRLEAELAHDYEAAKKAARRGAELAKTQADRAAARLRSGAAVVAQLRAARRHGACHNEPAAARAAVTDLQAAIEIGGPVVETTRLLLDAAILAADGPSALQAWHLYYGEPPSLLAPARVVLDRALPGWRDRELPAPVRSEIGLALAASGLYDEADAVLRDPCAAHVVQPDHRTQDVTTYADTLRRLAALSADSFRASARGERRAGSVERAIQAEFQALWTRLSWETSTPAYSWDNVQRELLRRFGTVISIGETDKTPTLLLGHRVLDEMRTVEQYGQKASLHFVQLDGMVSSGYVAWLTHGSSGTGGWIGSDAMYQIRPMYIDGPVLRWLRISEDESRSIRDAEIVAETKRDADRARNRPIQYYRGLDLRLQRAQASRIFEEFVASGVSAGALREAFIARLTRDVLETSIWAHEGRHAIDQQVFKIRNAVELEFRAKLSEIAFAPSPRVTASMLSPVGGPTAHGLANQRLLEGLGAWMIAHAAEIQNFDQGSPVLPQLDRLTVSQLLAAARSLDPLARSGL